MSDEPYRAVLERYRAQLWRGMHVNRWLNRVAVAVVLVALALAVWARNVWLIGVDATTLAVLVVSRRLYLARCAESDAWWQRRIEEQERW